MFKSPRRHHPYGSKSRDKTALFFPGLKVLKYFQSFIASWRGCIELRSLPLEDKNLVFYSEGGAYHGFLLPVISHLTEDHNLKIYYLTSDQDDPLLSEPPENVKSIYVGWGSAMIFAFQTLEAKVLVMTMPDLHSFHIKRSRYPVHYIYLQHSLVSSHMVYKPGAFDHFDTILCSGSHHVSEIREWEKLNNLPEKNLYEHGYAPLDTILDMVSSRPLISKPATSNYNVLVVPSWGSEGLIENGAKELVGSLLDAGHYVTLRLHPQSRINSAKNVKLLAANFNSHPNFEMDIDNAIFESLIKADVLISDWSGVSLEFAFGLERPVIFIDVPKKINNPRYTELENIPIEISARDKIGIILGQEKLDKVTDVVTEIMEDSEKFVTQIRALRDKTVFNIGQSAKRGSELIYDIVKK